MTNNLIVRTVCYFTDKPDKKIIYKLDSLTAIINKLGYEVQTKRICCPFENPKVLEEKIGDKTIPICVGSLSFKQTINYLPDFYRAKAVFFNTDLTTETIKEDQAEILFLLIKNKPHMTFNFTYVFNNKPSSPYFPSATYQKNGFTIGLQPTDLSEDCTTLQEWLEKVKASWETLHKAFGEDAEFLGIDSSIAPIFTGKGSLIHFIKRLGMSFNESTTTDIYVQITEFLKKYNPKPVGLCGLMMPCLEDFELANEYEQGNFSIERNIFLSLHSGLGIDTYPIGIDENPKKVVQILKLMQGLSNKYKKPLSIRFISDGKAKINEKTDFKNQYLKDVTVKKL